MVKITTPIPEYWADQWKNYWRQRILDRAWQAFVLLSLSVVVILIVSGGPGFIAATVIGLVISIILADDIKQTILDIWNRDFWVWRI